MILSLGNGRFHPREVDTGLITDDWAEITAGIDEGDKVVVSGQFLIDAESNLSAELERMAPSDPTAE